MFPRYSYSACVCGNRVIYIWQSNPRCIPLYVCGIPAGLFRVSISIYILPNIAFILTQMQGQTMRLFALVHTAQSAVSLRVEIFSDSRSLHDCASPHCIWSNLQRTCSGFTLDLVNEPCRVVTCAFSTVICGNAYPSPPAGILLNEHISNIKLIP